MPILLPNECWLDVLRFCSRIRLANTVSLCCRRLHALAHPLMHEAGAHEVGRMHLYGEPDDDAHGGFRAWSFADGRLYHIPLDMPPPKNIVCINTLCIAENVTPGLCAFIAFLARHGLLRELEVYDFETNDECGLDVSNGSKVLRDLLTQFPALFEQRPPPFTILKFAQRSALSCNACLLLAQHPLMLGLPALGLCIRSAWPERIGPLLDWLHWLPPAAAISSCNPSHAQRRQLHLYLGGEGDPQFLARFLEALQQRFLRAKRRRRPFRVVVWIWTNVEPWPEFVAQPELHNPRTREVLRVVAAGTDLEARTHEFHIDRQPAAEEQI